MTASSSAPLRRSQSLSSALQLVAVVGQEVGVTGVAVEGAEQAPGRHPDRVGGRVEPACRRGDQPFPEAASSAVVQCLAGVVVATGVHQEAPGGAVRPGLLVGRAGEVVVGRSPGRRRPPRPRPRGRRRRTRARPPRRARPPGPPGARSVAPAPPAADMPAVRVAARSSAASPSCRASSVSSAVTRPSSGRPASSATSAVVGGVVGEEERPGCRRVVPQVAEQAGQRLVLRRRVVVGAAGDQQGDGEEGGGRPPTPYAGH